MTTKEWLNQAKENEAKLISLVQNYHPRAAYRQKYERLPITAGGAEMACAIVRKNIQESGKDKPNPVDDLKDAINYGDFHRINTILNEA